MQNIGIRKHIWCRATAPAVRSESSLNSMGETLIYLQMRDGIQSPVVLAVLALHVLCVGQSLEMIMRKHVQTCLPRTETCKSMSMLICPDFKQFTMSSMSIFVFPEPYGPTKIVLVVSSIGATMPLLERCALSRARGLFGV